MKIEIYMVNTKEAALYDVDVHTINYHIKKIFNERELQEDSVIRKFRITAPDGKDTIQITAHGYRKIAVDYFKYMTKDIQI